MHVVKSHMYAWFTTFLLKAFVRRDKLFFLFSPVESPVADAAFSRNLMIRKEILGQKPAAFSIFLSASSFAFAAPFTLGNLGGNTLCGPHFIDLDASLTKRFAINERWGMELRGFIGTNVKASDLPPFFEPIIM